MGKPLTNTRFTTTSLVRIGMFTALTRQVIFYIPLVLAFPVFWGIDGIMFAVPAADSIAAIISIFFLVREMKSMTNLKAMETLQTG